jgi:hypothetical protein
METITNQLSERGFVVDKTETNVIWSESGEKLNRDFIISFNFGRGYDDNYEGDFHIEICDLNDNRLILGDNMTHRVLEHILVPNFDFAMLVIEEIGNRFSRFASEVL